MLKYEALVSMTRFSGHFPACLLAVFCTASASTTVFAAEGKAPSPVIVAEATSTEFVDRIEALGTLRANESVDIRANVSEIVTRLTFDDGQRVTKGDVLVELRAVEAEALIVEAESTANEAKQQFQRSRQLASTGASSVAALDEARRIYETARARLGAIQSRLTDLRVVAPFDGVVGLRNISVGALLQPGDLVTTLDDDSVMKLDFPVPSTFLSVVRPGIPIAATARAFGEEPFQGGITSVASRADPNTRSVIVRAEIPNPERRLIPGLLMTVEVLANVRESVTIPEEALMPLGTKNSVYVLDESSSPPVMRTRSVKIGARREGEVEIIDGISVGEKVVTRSDTTLSEGSAVTILATSTTSSTLSELLNSEASPTP